MRPLPCLPLVLAAALAGGEDPPLPAAVAREMDSHAARMAKIDQEAEKGRAEERARITKILDEALKAETKKGNLETALRIKQMRDGLQPKPASGESLLGDVPAGGKGPAGAASAPQAVMVGTWSMANGQTWVIKPGGVFLRQHTEEGGDSTGSWRIEGGGRIVLVYANGREFPLVRVDATSLVVLRDGSVEMGGQRVQR